MSNYFEQIHQQVKGLPGFQCRSMTQRNSENVQVDYGCYGWLAVNLGDVLVTVNEFPLLPALAAGLYGGFFGYMDNNRVYTAQYLKVVFTAGGANPIVNITMISLR